eukprot:gb/GECH01011942.1/.p1 GENE.gb/GECH01011942.1/~~gb/GECH01011942.1/.p1  ORF type:complete len:410 (+),score=125.15 gb/GECH01011942.1/:1-1230(+)
MSDHHHQHNIHHLMSPQHQQPQQQQPTPPPRQPQQPQPQHQPTHPPHPHPHPQQQPQPQQQPPLQTPSTAITTGSSGDGIPQHHQHHHHQPQQIHSQPPIPQFQQPQPPQHEQHQQQQGIQGLYFNSNETPPQLQQELREFWENQQTSVEHTTEFKNTELPLARIKKIMKSDQDVKMISAEAPTLFAKACEMFILELTLRAWYHTRESKRRTLQRNDIGAAISKTEIFDFLIDIVPGEENKAKRPNVDPQSIMMQQPQTFPMLMHQDQQQQQHPQQYPSHHPQQDQQENWGYQPQGFMPYPAMMQQSQQPQPQPQPQPYSQQPQQQQHHYYYYHQPQPVQQKPMQTFRIHKKFLHGNMKVYDAQENEVLVAKKSVSPSRTIFKMKDALNHKQVALIKKTSFSLSRDQQR